MPPRTSYPLTPALLAAHVGASVFCLAESGEGRTYRLHTERPGAELNARVGGVRSDLPSGSAHVLAPVEATPALIMVRADGPLEQRAGYHDPCGGWSDGHDALAERLCAAFAEGDVLFVADGPGGAAAGIQQAVARALAAKSQYGRRCTGFLDEMAGSAHAWWILAVCDEVFLPPMGQIGSIGARGGHLSTAGAMAKEGLVMTYFADPPAKVALAPEFPLSEEGARRGNRDVSIAADAFRAAVCAGPVGLRYGLTPEMLIALGADMLTGEAAVAAGLADGVESLEDVTAYALGLAESGSAKEIESSATGASRALTKGEGAMTLPKAGLRADGDEKPEKDNEEEQAAGTKPDGICASCGTGNPVAHKFCAQCGDSMAAKPMAEEEAPPSSKPAACVATPAARIEAPARVSADASLASILGAKGESPLAIKTAAIALRQIRDTAIGVTGKTDAGEIVGALLTYPERLARADIAAEDNRKAALTAAEAQRRNLAHRLNKIGLTGWKSTDIYTGAPVNGVRALSPTVAKWDLAEFKGYVEGHEASAPRVAPFDAARANAETDADARAASEGITAGNPGVPMLTDGKPTAAQIAKATKDPTVLKMFHAQGNTRTIEALAENFVIAAAQNGASLGGAL